MGLEAGTLTGTTDGFTGSMADTMLKAMEKEWLIVKGRPLPASGRQDLKLMFAAIAQGVVRHLEKNQDAFHTAAANDHTHAVQIDTTGGYLHPFS